MDLIRKPSQEEKQFLEFLGQLSAGITSAVGGLLSSASDFVAGFVGGFAGGFVSGVLGAAISGASLEDTLLSGVITGIVAGTLAGLEYKRPGAKVQAAKKGSDKSATPAKTRSEKKAARKAKRAARRAARKGLGGGNTKPSVEPGPGIWGGISIEEHMALYGDDPYNPNNNWFSHANNAVGTAAFAASQKGGSFRIFKGGGISYKYYPSGWIGGSPARITTHSLTNLGRGLGRISTFGGITSGAMNFANSDMSWGDYGALGVSGLSIGLTAFPEPITTVIGLGIGVTDSFGGFDDFYRFLDYQQTLYR